MKFSFDGSNYRIRFHHQHTPDVKWPRGYKPIMVTYCKNQMVKAITRCFIEKEVEEYAHKWKHIDEGMASCSTSDRYTKEQGRRISLQRAVAKLPVMLRTLAWNSYNLRHDYPNVVMRIEESADDA